MPQKPVNQKDEAGPELVLYNGKITTLDSARQEVSALAIQEGRILALGNDAEIKALAKRNSRLIDLAGRRAIPGLNDSHLHLIRGGLNFNMELRWEGVPSLKQALQMLQEQARRTPPPQWVRVIGGWTEFQFAERRMPNLEEINAAAPDTPVFVLHLYDRALLNAAALRAVGYTKDTPDPPGGKIQRDKKGNPTGMLIAEPNALILYSTLAKGPKLNPNDQANSTRHFMRELNRLGLTSCIDAGGGFQNYPDDYQVIDDLHKKGQLTLRISYNLFTQNPGKELEDFTRWASQVVPYSGDSVFRPNGAGEMLVFSAADFEDFLYPRPDMPGQMESDLKKVIQFLVEKRWPFRLHATYNETIERALHIFEEVNRDVPFNKLCWFFDHAETVTDGNLERIKALGGGIAIQHRMAFQGEYFIERYGEKAAEQSPPIRKMLAMGLPVGAGTDATRVASYNPWTCLYWLVTGKTVGGTRLYGPSNTLDRHEALRLYTYGSAQLSREENVKGTLAPGQYADLALLSRDYFTVPFEEIKSITSVLTLLGGKVVYGAEEYAPLDPNRDLPISPSWSPTKFYKPAASPPMPKAAHACPALNPWSFGCDCFAY